MRLKLATTPIFRVYVLSILFSIPLLNNAVAGSSNPVAVFNLSEVIHGKVLVAGKGLAGVSVQLKGSRTGTITDDRGDFSITVPDEAAAGGILVFSFVGYVTQEIPISGRSEINVTLEEIAGNLGEIVLVGSRGGGRVKTESPVPVDVIGINSAIQTTARPDITSLLNYAAPSFNYNKQSGSDGADQIDLATLRGLGPDQTLGAGKRKKKASNGICCCVWHKRARQLWHRPQCNS